MLTGGVRGDPVRPLSLLEPKSAETFRQAEQSFQMQDVTAEPPSVGLSNVPQPFRLEVQADSCPFAKGIALSSLGDKKQLDYATIPLCYPLEVTPRVDGALEVGAPVGSSRQNLTSDQKLAAGILHDYVEKQQKWQNQQEKSEAPCTPVVASPAGLAFVDVEAPFSPHAMEELQQPRPCCTRESEGIATWQRPLQQQAEQQQKGQTQQQPETPDVPEEEHPHVKDQDERIQRGTCKLRGKLSSVETTADVLRDNLPPADAEAAVSEATNGARCSLDFERHPNAVDSAGISSANEGSIRPFLVKKEFAGGNSLEQEPKRKVVFSSGSFAGDSVGERPGEHAGDSSVDLS